MNIPSRSQCLEWLKEVKMPQNIVEHSLAVNRVAVFLAKRINQNKIQLDVDLVDRGSLVHDIDKHLTFENGLHGMVGKKFLEDKGFPQLGLFCITHNLNYVLENEFPSLEHKVIYYSDKRVKGNKIVTIEERLGYILDRYGSRSSAAYDKIIACKKPLEEIEKKILSLAKISSLLEGLE